MTISTLEKSTWALAIVGAFSVIATASCSTADPAAPITTNVALRDDMRMLWSEHVLLTRVFLIADIGDRPDTDAATQRLLQNQTDLGNAIRPFYGEAAGDRLTALLREHITGAAAVVAAAKAHNTIALTSASAAWYANAHEIAVFLADANPFLAVADLDAMMRTHLDQTLASASARIDGNWATDAQTYDAIVDHVLHMADAISAALQLQFPAMVAVETSVSASSGDFHVAMRALWIDHVAWTRVFLIVAIADGQDTDAAQARLLRNQVDIGNAIKPYYGEAAGQMLASLLHDHITLAARVVVDAKSGNMADLSVASGLWYANADEIAAFLAGANPRWPAADLQAMMRAHLDQTLAEATARLESDWSADVAAYDAVSAHILHMSDALADGIVAQFPDRFAH